MSDGPESQPKPRTVQFKSEQGKTRQVNLNVLDSAFKDIQEFNRGSSSSKGLLLLTQSAIDKDFEDFSSEVDKSKALSEVLSIFHTDSFNLIGISLSLRERILNTPDTRFDLEDPDKFLSFLKALEKKEVESSRDKATEALLSKIGYDMFLQIYQHYNNYQVDERVPQIEIRLSAIISRYKNLGIRAKSGETDRTEDLETYARYADQGILGEYVVANYSGLLYKPNDEKNSSATLANWRNDIGSKLVQSRWEKAISILEQLRSNPKAIELMQEVKNNLSACINAALRDIDSKDEDWDKENEWVKRKEKREIFENARINLQIL